MSVCACTCPGRPILQGQHDRGCPVGCPMVRSQARALYDVAWCGRYLPALHAEMAAARARAKRLYSQRLP